MHYKTIDQFPEIAKWFGSFVNVKTSQRRLARGLGDLLRRYGHPVSVHSDVDKELDRNTLIVSAEYDIEEDEEGKSRYIHLTLITNPKSTTRLVLNKDAARDISMDVLEALVHEYQHEHQHRSRNFQIDQPFRSVDRDHYKRSQQEYLGMLGEIDAFASNIALRYWILYGNNAMSMISEGSKLKFDTSPDLWGYYEAFGPNHIIIKRLISKICKNIQSLIERNLERIKNGIVNTN